MHSAQISLNVVGGIMVLFVTFLYPPVLTLRTDHCHYKPGILLLACFFDQIYRNPFSTSSKLWLLGHIIYHWNRRKWFSSGGEILGTSLANVNLRGGIDSRSLSMPLGGLNCDVRLPEMLQ